MANKPKALFRGPVTAAGIDTSVPTSKQWIVTNAIVTNYGNVSATFNIRLDGIILVYGVNLDAGAIFTLDCVQVLDSGKILRVSASVDNVIAAHISGVESDS